MIIYIEKSLRENQYTKWIYNRYKDFEILEIDNYKNIFDKKISVKPGKSLVFASVNNSISKTPPLYGHPWWGYFFKNSLNCVFDCSYCYLKGAFKNEQNIFFLNYDHIKRQIQETIKSSKEETNRFYSSDYSDNLATDNITNFCQEFIPFFAEQKNAKMEIRTKSTNISRLLSLAPNSNIEIAFSLNPQKLIDRYERKTPSLEERIEAVNKLLAAWWQVWIRFIPLLDCEDSEKIYADFINTVINQLDITKIYSIFIGGLMFTHEDYNQILKKNPYLDLLHKLDKEKSGFYREDLVFRKKIYTLFQEKLSRYKVNICMDS